MPTEAEYVDNFRAMTQSELLHLESQAADLIPVAKSLLLLEIQNRKQHSDERCAPEPSRADYVYRGVAILAVAFIGSAIWWIRPAWRFIDWLFTHLSR